MKPMFATLLAVIVFFTNSAAQTTRPTTAPEHRFESEIAKFEAHDAKTKPPAHPILFVGSSSIRLWKTSEAFPDLQVLNRGFGGSAIDDVIFFAPRIVVKYKPRIVVFYSGDNDIADGRSAQVVADDFAQFLVIVRKELPDAKLIFIGIKPSLARWKFIETMRDANRRIKAMLESVPHSVFIDVEAEMLGADGKPKPELFGADGLHMNDRGYKIWNRLVQPYLH